MYGTWIRQTSIASPVRSGALGWACAESYVERPGVGETTAVTIGLLHPSEMGAAIGAALRASGKTVLWASTGPERRQALIRTQLRGTSENLLSASRTALGFRLRRFSHRPRSLLPRAGRDRAAGHACGKPWGTARSVG